MASRKSVYDIMVSSGELQFKEGDFLIAESTAQHQEHLLLAEKGNYMEWPLAGVGIASEILNDDSSVNGLMTLIQKEFEADGMAVDYLQIKQGNVKVNAGYKF